MRNGDSGCGLGVREKMRDGRQMGVEGGKNGSRGG